jgi:predicted deacylase
MSLSVFGHRVTPGKSETFPVKVGEYADGTPIGLTMRVAVGSHDGPRIAMLGLQHGDEYGGMEISNGVFDGVDPKQFKGSLITIPVSNPLAFNAAERASPPPMGYENLNMNRVWPGEPKGLLMERIAAQVWEQVIKESEIVVDLHEGGRGFMARYIHARGTPETERLVGEHNKRLYRLFGQGVPVLGGVNTRPSMIGSLSIQAGLVGIPTLSPELGGGGRLWEDFVQTGIQGVKNVMIGLGMLNEESVGSDSEQLVSDGSSWPKMQHGGVIYNCCELGAVVEEGTLLGVLKDTAGRVLEKCRAPYRSVIFDTRYQPTVYPGDWTYHCGRLV